MARAAEPTTASAGAGKPLSEAPAGGMPVPVAYHAEADTLTDNFGVIYYRTT